jgi:hypothetical protein
MPEKEPWLRKALRFRLSKQEKSERNNDGNRQDGQFTPPVPPTSAQKETATSPPEQLWDQAYDNLKHDEPKLFKLYKTILSRDLDSSEGMKENVIKQNRTKRRSQIDCLLNTGLDKTARLVHVEKNIGDAINIILSVKEAVGSALQVVPIAAIARTGVCIALQASSPLYSTSVSEHVRSF